MDKKDARFRIKPKPREWWLGLVAGDELQGCRRVFDSPPGGDWQKVVHVREVLENE